MRREILDLASDLARRGAPFALATVVARRPPISTQVGDTALVTGDGAFHGWVGGSCTRPTVIAESLKALAEGKPRRVALDPDPQAAQRPDVTVFPMTCHSGGSVEIHIQPVLPQPRLLVYGASPTARALARLGKALGWTVHAVDPEADSGGFPDVDGLWTDPAALRLEGPAPVAAVVATQGEWDEEAILAALARSPDYLGVMASAKRFGQMRSVLAAKASEADLARITNPAGLDLGARLPEEIALSILAEIVQVRRAAAAAAVAVAAEPAAAEEEARDPVCGMTVRVGHSPQAEHQGRTYYFCCGGCRTRFLAEPERYLQAVST